MQDLRSKSPTGSFDSYKLSKRLARLWSHARGQSSSFLSVFPTCQEWKFRHSTTEPRWLWGAGGRWFVEIHHAPHCNQFRRSVPTLLTLLVALVFPYNTNGQTSSSGALTGVSIDPTGAVLPGAVVRLVSQET